MIITIDGPAGSGKSTAARKLAALLEIPYLDTGAMYRAVTLKALQGCTTMSDPECLARVARESDIRLDCGPTHARVIMDGHDVSEAIRSMRVSEHTSEVARIPAVRQILIEKQREIGRRLASLVTEGRDQGSVVFPEADAKFLLLASDGKRAERRFHEMLADGEEVAFEDVLDNIRQRDVNDQAQWAPLMIPGEAIVIDTTHMSIGDVVDRMRIEVERLRSQPELFSSRSKNAR